MRQSSFLLTTLTALTLTCLTSISMAWDFVPLELLNIPINGTEQSEDPAVLRGHYRFSTRPANKMVEHGDTISLLDEIDYLETPHIDWVGNYSEGPIRILWVVQPSGNLRDPVEIEQRSDFQITRLDIPMTLRVHPDDEVLNRFFAKRYDAILDQEYDVIVLRSYAPRIWRSDQRHPVIASVYERIEAKVRGGCGLVCQLASDRWFRGPDGGDGSLPDDNAAYDALSPLYYGHGKFSGIPVRQAASSPVTDGISFAAWPLCQVTQSTADEGAEVLATVDGHPIVALGSCGKGRTVSIHFQTFFAGSTSLIPVFDSETDANFGDYYEAVYPFWLRALAWAAGKPPRIGLSAADVTPCRAGTAPEVAWTLTGGPGSPESVVVRYQLTDAFGDRLSEGKLPVRLAGEPVEVMPQLPVLKANGLYRMDVFVSADSRTYNWGTAAVRVEGGVSMSVKSPKEPVRPGEPAAFQVSISGAGDRLHVLGVDGADRVFFDRTLPATDGDTVTVDTTLSKLPANRVFFTLRQPGSEAALARCAVTLYLPRIGLRAAEGQFVIASYGQTPATPHLWPYSGLLYRAAGLNTNYFNWHSRDKCRWSAETGLLNISGAGWPFKQKGFDKIHHHSPNDPEVREQWKQIIAQNADDVRTFGGIGRVLGDESWFAHTASAGGEMRGAQLTQDPYSLALFREAMRTKYRDIAALNEMWGTDFKSFDQVRVIDEDAIRENDNPSGWLEFREYMNWTYAARYFGWVDREHREALGPDYRSGTGAPHWTTHEGGATYRGGDPGQMREHMHFMMLYGSGSADYPDAYVGQPGGQKYDPPQEWKSRGAWAHVFEGADALWYYIAFAVVGPELAWRRHAVWMKQGVDDIVQGCGELITGAERVNSGVKMLSTSPNQAMGWLFAKRKDHWNALRLSFGHPQSAGTFASLMKSRFFRIAPTYEQDVQAGDLKDCKLLLLPQQLNMSDATVEAIRAYVREGGTVVADVQPATRYAMGKPRGNSALADVFGVDCSEASVHQESESWYSVGIQSPADAAETFSKEIIWLPNQVTFHGIRPTTAVAHARILSKTGQDGAGCFINRYGKGKALLLNFVYRDFNLETLSWHSMFGDALLAWSGVRPPARILDPQTGAALPYRPLYAFRRGAATLLGSVRGDLIHSGGSTVLIDPGRALSFGDEATFAWEGGRHTYDVRGRKYLGFGESATVDLPSFEGRLLCLLPYKVECVALSVPERSERGRRVTVHAAVQTDGAAPAEHVFYFQVTSPTGAKRPLYCAVRRAPEGEATFDIPLALNEPLGRWTITARDVMTGTESTAHFQLESLEQE